LGRIITLGLQFGTGFIRLFYAFFHSCTVHLGTIKYLYLSNWCTVRLL